jgi:peptide methionine sulfoxide reductase MsrA
LSGTGHAEAIVVFDPGKLSYEGCWIISFCDPTTPNRQHNDVGTRIAPIS